MIEKEEFEHREKLISFPNFILDKLDEYKQKTGISSTAYIRLALIKAMVLDKLIYFKTKYIITNQENQINKNSIPESLKYCDSEHCEVNYDKN